MRKLTLAFFCCCLLSVLFPAPMHGQFLAGIPPVTGTINSSGATCTKLVMDSTNSGPSNCVSEPLPSTANSASIVLTGTFSATVQFELTADNGNTWVAAPIASSTSAGTTNFSFGAYNGVRARASAYSSGSISVTIMAGNGSLLTVGSLNAATSAAVYVSAFAGSSADVQMIAAQTLSFAGAHIVTDLKGDQMIKAHPMLTTVLGDSVTFSGSMVIPGPVKFHMQGADSWIVPSQVDMDGGGQGLPTNPTNTQGVVIQACNSASQTFAGCTQNLPNNNQSGGPGVPMMICHVTCAENGSTQGFETWISHVEIDCNFLASCRTYENFEAQENSGASFLLLVNWGNGGIGINLGASSGAGSSVNSAYEHLNMGQGNGGGIVCTAGAIGIQIASGGAPKDIHDVTISNTNCPTQPNYNIVVTGASTYIVAIDGVHCEGFQIYCVYLSQAASTKAVHLRNISACCNTAVAASAVVGINAGAVATFMMEDIQSFNGSGPPNVLVDSTNGCTILAAKVVVHYELNNDGSIGADSTGTCPATQKGFVNNGYNQNRTSVYSNLTTTPSTVFTYTFPANAFTYTLHCGGVWQASAITTGLALSVVFGTAPTNASASGLAQYSAVAGTNAFTAGGTGAITTTASTPILTTTVANAANAKYMVMLDITAEIAAAGSTMQIQAADTDNTATVQILRDFACK